MYYQPMLTSAGNPGSQSDAELLDSLVQWEREVRKHQAWIARGMAVLVERAQREDALFGADCAISEIAEALNLHPSTAHSQVVQAVAVVDRHLATWEAWASGQVTAQQVARLVQTTDRLGDDIVKAREIEERVLPKMPGQILQATRRALSRVLLAVDPEGAKLRQQRAAKQREVTMAAEQDGMATVFLNTTAEQATAVYERVDQAARAQDPQDGRTLAQRRADAMCAMILDTPNAPAGQGPATPAALVQVTVSLETLLALNANPGELERYGAISADTARALAMAPGSLWRWLAYDPETGALIKTSPRVYQPTAEVRRFVQARDRVCAFPGCTRPACRCDLDHVDPFDHDCPACGGQTDQENLVPLCRHHHRIKTVGGFTVKVIVPGRSVEWTSRHTGRTYRVDHAHDYRPDQELDILAGWEL
ncbi:MAG TPA: DUF222 domain-containing protein [Actinocrinis sp.]